jgi:hypothetical protein
MTIHFGHLTFSSPTRLSLWSPEPAPGLYVVCVPDNEWGPAPFRPICFGLSENLAERGLLRAHPQYESWIENAGSATSLWIADVHLPEFSAELREVFLRQLIGRYRPAFNPLEPLPPMKIEDLKDENSEYALEQKSEEAYA